MFFEVVAPLQQLLQFSLHFSQFHHLNASFLHFFIVEKGFLYKGREISLVQEFVCEEFSLYLVVLIFSSIMMDSVKLTFGDVIDPPGMVAALVMNEGIASSRFYKIGGIYFGFTMVEF